MTFLGMVEAFVDLFASIVFVSVPVMGVEVQLIVVWLTIAMFWSTLWLGIPQIRGFSEAFLVLRGRFFDPDAPGEITQFTALSTALSGTLGLGNIAGVAVAITAGGPGAIFWMALIGILAMALKCAEVTLALLYREVRPDGTVNGGPFRTLTAGLAAAGRPRLGRFLGNFYGIAMLFACVSFFQVNQAQAAVAAQTPLKDGALFGILFSAAVGLVLLGSIRWIGKATSILVPVMSLVYMGGCFAILVLNADAIPGAIETILVEAFNPGSIWGGALGAFIVGMRRTVFSTEAGLGTSTMAHAQAKTHHPASEGLVALVEPFFDTVLMCTLTGLTIVAAGTWDDGLSGIEIATAAFAQISPWFPLVLMVAVVLFAYASVVATGFYGYQAFEHLFGHGRKRGLTFKILLLLLLPLGAILDLGRVVDFVDAAYFLLGIPNTIGLYLLAAPLREEMDRYLLLRAQTRAGVIPS